MASLAAASSLAGAGSALPSPSTASSRKVFVAFNGLKASPIVVKSSMVKSPSIRSSWRPVNATCTTEADTLEQCQKIVAEQLGVEAEKVKPDSKFSDLGADSLDTVEIVMALEEKFKITVEQEGAEKIVTVKDAADVIHQLISKKESA